MAAYLQEHLLIDDEQIDLVDVGGGTFQVLVKGIMVFDNRDGNGRFPVKEDLLEEIKKKNA